MKASELRPPPAIPLPPVIPVICDQCRQTGIAGDPAFSGIPDILEFDPVPRRAHVNNWTPEHQRAFIAALALTGSPRIAARTIGRHAFGAEQLRKARGGRSFADAWDAALDLARERELARIHGNLAELAAQALSPPRDGARRGWGAADDDPPEYDYDPEAVAATQARFCRRLLAGRRMFLLAISGDAQRRAAWDMLCGPADWGKAETLLEQADEPGHDGSLDRPDIFIPAEQGWVGEFTGGEDKLGQLRDAWEEYERTGEMPGVDSENPPRALLGDQHAQPVRGTDEHDDDHVEHGGGAGDADKDPSPPGGTEARSDAGGIGSTAG